MKRIKIITLCLIMAFSLASCNKPEETTSTTAAPAVIAEVSDAKSAQANIDRFVKDYNDYCTSESSSFNGSTMSVTLPNGSSGKGTYRHSEDNRFCIFTIEVEDDTKLEIYEYFKISDTDMFLAVSTINKDGTVEESVKYYATQTGFYELDGENFATVSDASARGLFASFAQLKEFYE